MDHEVIDQEFAADIVRGLGSSPKFLMSRYFYDARGDAIFQDIMNAPEYYLTDCEIEILRDQGANMAREIKGNDHFELIELGSGDGSKICHLLDALNDLGADFTFRPVDISLNSLELLENHLRPGRPWLDINPLHVNYMEWLSALEPGSPRKVIAFMGSNLGNFTHARAVEFLSLIRKVLSPEDSFLVGLDLKKDPAIIKAAYNDAAGHTRAFNLNLLRRINRELGGDFDLNAFEHEPVYDPETGAAESYLRSLVEQTVVLKALGQRFNFAAGEQIFMEVSQKYDQPMIDRLAGQSGFSVNHVFTDKNDWFTDQLWVPEISS